MYIYPYIMKRDWLKNESNYFVTCKYFRLILESLQTVKNVYMHIYFIYAYIYIYKHIYIYTIFQRKIRDISFTFVLHFVFPLSLLISIFILTHSFPINHTNFTIEGLLLLL